jgi:hypothetical protein
MLLYFILFYIPLRDRCVALRVYECCSTIIAPLVITTFYNGFGQIHAPANLLNYVHTHLLIFSHAVVLETSSVFMPSNWLFSIQQTPPFQHVVSFSLPRIAVTRTYTDVHKLCSSVLLCTPFCRTSSSTAAIYRSVQGYCIQTQAHCRSVY